MNRNKTRSIGVSALLVGAIAVACGGLAGNLRAQAPGPSSYATALQDKANPSRYIPGSSIPQDGMFLPLGPYLFVDPGGFVGIGTKNPFTTLDVDASGSGGLRVFDGPADLFTIDAATSSLGIGLADWSVTVPTVVTLPDATPALNFKTGDGWSVLSLDAVNRRVGISGGSSDASVPLYPLHVQHNVNDDYSMIVTRSLTDVSVPFDTDRYYYGAWSTARVPGGSSSFSGSFTGLSADGSIGTTGTVERSIGVQATAQLYADGLLRNCSGVQAYAWLWQTGHIENARAVEAQVGNEGTGTIDNAYGIYVETPVNEATISNAYGVYIAPQDVGDTAYALYSAGGDSYFAGNVGIGDPAPTNVLTVAQNSKTDPVADAWTQYSSRRWKENVAPIPDALEKVQRLRGVSYDWKKDGRHDVGFIAEEVGEVIPEVVEYESNGVDARSLDYARLTALLVEAVKEQQRQIDQLRDEVHLLEQQLER